MPVPGRGNDNIPAFEGELLAFYGCEARTVDDEATCVGDVSVCWSNLAWIDKL